jgi:Ca2+-binding EF-hand superfamily protein
MLIETYTKYEVCETDLSALMRRIDKDNDGEVSFQDFF